MPVTLIKKPAAPKLPLKAAVATPSAPKPVAATQTQASVPKLPVKSAKAVPKTVTIAKPEQAAPVSSTLAEGAENFDLTLEELADKFGDLSDRANALSLDPVFQHLRMAKEELMLRLAEFKAEDAVTIKGSKWMVEAGACSKAPRKITDPEKVMGFVGKPTFMKLAKISVSDAEKYLTPEQLSKVVSEEELTANRKVAYVYIGK